MALILCSEMKVISSHQPTFAGTERRTELNLPKKYAQGLAFLSAS